MVLQEEERRLALDTALFRGLPEALFDWTLAQPGCARRGYARGAVVYSPQSFARSLGILLSGALRVTKRRADGHELVISTLRPGALFGAAALFHDEAEYATTLTARLPSAAVFLPQEALSALFRRSPEAAERYIRYLSGRVLFLNRKLHALTAGTAEQRLAGFLLDNLPEGEAARLPMPMTGLASALNMSRASLYRALDLLLESGALAREGRALRLTDPARLRALYLHEGGERP